jgi:hypothetical protein
MSKTKFYINNKCLCEFPAHSVQAGIWQKQNKKLSDENKLVHCNSTGNKFPHFGLVAQTLFI